MNPKSIVIIVAVFTVAFAGFSQTNRVSNSNSVELHNYGRTIVLAGDNVQTFSTKSLDLLKTSEFNSSKGNWPVSEVQKDYDQTISGKYTIVSFNKPQKIKTEAGEISVQKILLGLDGSHFSGMFTMDETGKMIEQGKYRGDEWIELMKLADKIASNN